MSENTDEDLEREFNPRRYRSLSEPFDDRAEANEALQGFFDEVKAARFKYGLPDVFVAVECTTGEDMQRAVASLYMGDPVANKLPMLARLYGEARAQHEEALGEMIKAGRASVEQRRR